VAPTPTRRNRWNGTGRAAVIGKSRSRCGTPLAQSMQNIARSERMQRAARIAAQIERLPVLMSLPMLLLVTPGTIMLVAGPAFLIAMNTLRGLGGQ